MLDNVGCFLQLAAVQIEDLFAAFDQFFLELFHGCAVQYQFLGMKTVLSEEERIFGQDDDVSLIDNALVAKELVRKDDYDVHVSR
jgi:hypothetical protein